MKRIATITAAIALASAAGLAQAAPTGTYGSQVSQDDFSVMTGPKGAPAGRTDGYQPQASDMTEQGLTGPRVKTSHSTVSRDEVVRERDQARAAGAFEPGAEYRNALAAPNDPTWNGGSRVMGGQ